MKEKAIRKGTFLYHMLWCRLYSDVVTIPLLVHHFDEFKRNRLYGFTVSESLAMILYEYYPKWAEHVDKMIQYK